MTKVNGRVAEHPIESFFLERWSPRAFTGEAMPDADLKTIFEAARWAPSSFNAQPWRFIYARRDTAAFGTFESLLSELNRSWAKNAAVLAIVVSQKTITLGKNEPRASRSHSFDAGAAWAYLALQASLLGYGAHGMGGFDHDRAAAELNVPDDYRVEIALALGRPGDKSLLPESLAARETPNGRNPQSDFVFEGKFTALDKVRGSD